MGVDDVYRLGSELDIPCRPPWDYSMSKEEVWSGHCSHTHFNHAHSVTGPEA